MPNARPAAPSARANAVAIAAAIRLAGSVHERVGNLLPHVESPEQRRVDDNGVEVSQSASSDCPAQSEHRWSVHAEYGTGCIKENW